MGTHLHSKSMTVVGLVRSSIWLAANIDLSEGSLVLWCGRLIQHALVVLGNNGDGAAVHRTRAGLLLDTSLLDHCQMTRWQFLQGSGNFLRGLASNGIGNIGACASAHDEVGGSSGERSEFEFQIAVPTSDCERQVL